MIGVGGSCTCSVLLSILRWTPSLTFLNHSTASCRNCIRLHSVLIRHTQHYYLRDLRCGEFCYAERGAYYMAARVTAYALTYLCDLAYAAQVGVVLHTADWSPAVLDCN